MPWREFIALLYPDLCSSCQNHLLRQEEFLCLYCECSLPKTDFHDIKDNKTEKLLWGRVNFSAATSFLFFAKKGITQRLLHQLKYNNRPDLGVELGRIFGSQLLNSKRFQEIDLIVPIPLHRKKYSERGYNQSQVIAEGLSEYIAGKVSDDNLIRIKNNTSQTSKGRQERWEGLSNDFEIKDESFFKNKKILILDDVVTTGATLEACCRLFERIEGVELFVATLAIPLN